MKEIIIEIKKPELIILFLFLAVVFIYEVMVTLSSPIAFGDEGFHIRFSQHIAKEKEYPVWNIFEETKLIKSAFGRPPLWNLLVASFYFALGENEVIVKVLTPFIAFLSGISVFLFCKRNYGKEIGIIAAIITVTIPSFVTYSVLFYTDALLIFYFVLFLFFFKIATETKNKKYLILSGVFAAFCILTKTPGVVVIAILGLNFFYQLYRRRFDVIKDWFIIGLSLMLITSGYFLRNLVQYHSFSCYLPILNIGGVCSKSFDYKNSYTSETPASKSGVEQNIINFGIFNYIEFAYGNIWLVALPFLCGLFILFLKKEWEFTILLISFIPIFYLGSQGRAEDMARYTISFVPIVGIVSARYFFEIFLFVRKYYSSLAILVFILILIFGFMEMREKLNTMKRVKGFSKLFFEACDNVKREVEKNALFLTIWDHQTIYNCQRNAIGPGNLPDNPDIMLSGDINLTTSRLKAHGFTHIFIQKFSLSKEGDLSGYPINFVQFLENNPEKFKKIYENGERNLNRCIYNGCDGTMIYEIL